MTWPNDLQTRFCQYTGIPLDWPHWKTTGATSTLGCHWNNTGWCYHPVVFQWRSSVNLHNWNTLEGHWKTTGSTLGTQWLPTILSPAAFQCTLGTKCQAHWIATGLPLNYHWLRVRVWKPNIPSHLWWCILDTQCTMLTTDGNSFYLGYELATFLWMTYFDVVWNVQCFCSVVEGNFRVMQLCEFRIAINPCTGY